MFSNNYMRDGHSRVSNLFGEVYRSRFVFPALGLLNVVLLLTAIVLGIYCNKSKERYLEPLQTSEHIPYILELNFLRENNSEVIKATQEAEKTLKMEATKNEGIKGQLEKQKSLNDNLQSQIERARKDKAKLLAAKLHLADLVVIDNWAEQIAELEMAISQTTAT
ncbi:hypothetical protein CRUP_004490 [Coryphaenoides rupestris]|nr:hypothetical protein CRUP_004490 [Coryphaenoides rupestris]